VVVRRRDHVVPPFAVEVAREADEGSDGAMVLHAVRMVDA
jgi:hypothetical protein